MTGDSFLHKELRYGDGHWPRENLDSMMSPDYVPKIAYTLYSDTRTNVNKRTADDTEILNLVFVHGAQMCKELWDFHAEMCFLDPLIGPYLGTVVAVENICHGDSYVANAGNVSWSTTWADSARDINKVVRSLEMRGTTILVGHSMGATQSFYAALFDPGLYDSIVAIDCVGYSTDGRFDDKGSIQQLGRTYQKLVKMIKTKFKSEEEYLRYHEEVGIAKKFHPKCKEAYIKASRIDHPDGTIEFKTPDLHQLAIYMSGQYAYRDAKYVARQLDCEIFHIWGTRENKREAKLWRQSFRYGSFYDIPDEGHLVPFEKPVEVFNAYRNFLIRRRARGSQFQRELNVRRRFTLDDRTRFNRSGVENVFSGLLRGERRLDSKL